MSMKNPSESEVLELVGEPEYTLLTEEDARNPLEVWEPPPCRKKFTPDDLFELFKGECVAFVGDSTDRRAADTHHILIENRNNLKNESFAKPAYIYNFADKHSHQTRIIGGKVFETSSTDSRLCLPGTVDNVWANRKRDIAALTLTKNYTVILANALAWDNVHSTESPNEMVKQLNQSLHHLHNVAPASALLIWKTSAWSREMEWRYLEPDEQALAGSTSNYLVYLANKEAKEIIDRINATNFIYVDWSKEIAPYSFKRRVKTNMQAENRDDNNWHVGPKARGLLIQMFAWEVYKRRHNVTCDVELHEKDDLNQKLWQGNETLQSSKRTNPAHAPSLKARDERPAESTVPSSYPVPAPSNYPKVRLVDENTGNQKLQKQNGTVGRTQESLLLVGLCLCLFFKYQRRGGRDVVPRRN